MLTVGQPISVTLDTEIHARRTGDRTRRMRPERRGGEGGAGGVGAGGGAGRRGGGIRRDRRPVRTQEDLDKELDEFMSGPPPATNLTTGDEMAVD